MRKTWQDRAHGFVHFLYEPALLGKGCAAVSRWRAPFHRIHLIRAAWLDAACKRYDAHLGITGPDDPWT